MKTPKSVDRISGMKQVFEGLLVRLREACQEVYGDRLVSLCVFGSVAAGTMKPDSDIDILLVCDVLPKGRMARVMEFEAVDRLCEDSFETAMRQGVRTMFSPHIKTPAEVLEGSLVFLDMTDTVRILFDREEFVGRYLRTLKERLSRLGARKVRFGGGYYWILKPNIKPGEEITL
jgi:predicted nucleotidyltransferase